MKFLVGLLATLFLAGEDLNFNIFTKPVKTPPTIKKVEYETVKVRDPYYHTHRCWCGHEWSHTDASFGNVNDHRCERCGRIQWNKHETSTKIIKREKANGR